MDKASMESLVGRSVRVDRGGPESRSGKLLSVQQDYFVLYCENEGIVYYKKDHVKSLTLDSREVSDVIEAPVEGEAPPPVLQYFEADSFTSVLQSMHLYSVQINRGGPEKIEGVIVDATDDEVTLIVGKEVVKILPFHIRNISYSAKNNSNEQNNSNSSSSKGNRNSRNSRR